MATWSCSWPGRLWICCRALGKALGVLLGGDRLALGTFLAVVHLVANDPDAAPVAGLDPVAHALCKPVIVLGEGDGSGLAIAVVEAGDGAKAVVCPAAIVESAVMRGIVPQFVGEHDPALFALVRHQELAAGVVQAKDVLGELVSAIVRSCSLWRLCARRLVWTDRLSGRERGLGCRRA